MDWDLNYTYSVGCVVSFRLFFARKSNNLVVKFSYVNANNQQFMFAGVVTKNCQFKFKGKAHQAINPSEGTQQVEEPFITKQLHRNIKVT